MEYPKYPRAIGADGRQPASDERADFCEMLRRVGGDYAESGSEFTAEDYFEAAERIENLSAELAEALRTIPEAGR